MWLANCKEEMCCKYATVATLISSLNSALTFSYFPWMDKLQLNQILSCSQPKPITNMKVHISFHMSWSGGISKQFTQNPNSDWWVSKNNWLFRPKLNACMGSMLEDISWNKFLNWCLNGRQIEIRSSPESPERLWQHLAKDPPNTPFLPLNQPLVCTLRSQTRIECVTQKQP